MVPKIHKKGRSFRTTAHYVLHDANAKTKDRVSWTATWNMATRDPDLAWRVMAATAMDQQRLKQQSGVPNTGRKSKDHVLHFTLSWHPDEAKSLDRREMLKAAKAILHVMGAQEHQCLFVAHRDQPQPHVHVLVNRVHPRDGRMLSSSFERLKASRWAEQYEKMRGKIYCTERVVNNAARDRGEFTRGAKDLPRHLFDALAGANDNEKRQQLLTQHRLQAARLKAEGRKQKERHQAAWQKFEQGHKKRLQAIELKAKSGIAKRIQQLRQDFRPRWLAQHHEFDAARQIFEQRELRVLGRLQNALNMLDLGKLVGKGRPLDGGRAKAIGDLFSNLASAGARRQTFDQQQAKARRELLAQQRRREARTKQRFETERLALLDVARQQTEQERNDLVLSHSMDRAKQLTQWHQKRLAIRAELKKLRTIEIPPERIGPPTPSLTPAFRRAANPENRASDERSDQRGSVQPLPPKTNPSDVLPRDGRENAARLMDGWHKRRPHNTRRRERDDGHER